MPNTPTASFGDLLKQLRKRAGMTQSDLAAALGYSISLICALEQNRRLPEREAVLQINALYCGCNENRVFPTLFSNKENPVLIQSSV